jgi:AcrR family transcriptional regulator
MPAPPEAATASAPRVRKDVARNRALLLEAADKLIAVRGLAIGFHELATVAGVGVGTVYRHFPDKEALLGALIEQRFDAAREILLAAEQIDDPVEALRVAILTTCEHQFSDRAMWQAMVSVVEGHRDLARERLLPTLTRLVERARDSGRLRADFAVTDLPMIFFITGGLSQPIEHARPDLWRRYVQAILDGFIVDPADRTGSAVPAAATEDELESILSAR